MTAVRVTILGFSLAAVVGTGFGLGRAEASTSLQACLAECKKAKLSETNRASCRLDCETEAASDPELIRAQLGDPRPAPVAPPSLPATRPAAPTSPANIGDTPRTGVAGPGCKAACDADRTLSVDDRATCKLECDLDPDSPVNRTTPTTTPVPAPNQPPPRGGSPLTFQLSGPPPSAAAVAGFVDRCYAVCQQGPYKLSATDLETCKLDCQTMASVVDVARGFVPDAWTAPATTTPPTKVGTPPVTPATPTKVAVAPTPSPTPVPAKTTPPPRTASPDRSAVEICGDELSECNTRCSGAVKKCERGCGRKHVIETDRETCKLTCETDSEVCQNDCLAANATCVNSRQARPR